MESGACAGMTPRFFLNLMPVGRMIIRPIGINLSETKGKSP